MAVTDAPYSVRSLADRWGVHEETVRGYIRSGQLSGRAPLLCLRLFGLWPLVVCV